MTTLTEKPTNWRPADTLPTRVRLMREEMGLTQRAAAERAGIGFGAWQGIEAGRGGRDLHANLGKIVRTFGVDREWLVWGGPLATCLYRGRIPQHVAA